MVSLPKWKFSVMSGILHHFFFFYYFHCFLIEKKSKPNGFDISGPTGFIVRVKQSCVLSLLIFHPEAWNNESVFLGWKCKCKKI